MHMTSLQPGDYIPCDGDGSDDDDDDDPEPGGGGGGGDGSDDDDNDDPEPGGGGGDGDGSEEDDDSDVSEDDIPDESVMANVSADGLRDWLTQSNLVGPAATPGSRGIWYDPQEDLQAINKRTACIFTVSEITLPGLNCALGPWLATVQTWIGTAEVTHGDGGNEPFTGKYGIVIVGPKRGNRPIPSGRGKLLRGLLRCCRRQTIWVLYDTDLVKTFRGDSTAKQGLVNFLKAAATTTKRKRKAAAATPKSKRPRPWKVKVVGKVQQASGEDDAPGASTAEETGGAWATVDLKTIVKQENTLEEEPKDDTEPTADEQGVNGLRGYVRAYERRLRDKIDSAEQLGEMNPRKKRAVVYAAVKGFGADVVVGGAERHERKNRRMGNYPQVSILPAGSKLLPDTHEDYRWIRQADRRHVVFADMPADGSCLYSASGLPIGTDAWSLRVKTSYTMVRTALGHSSESEADAREALWHRYTATQDHTGSAATAESAAAELMERIAEFESETPVSGQPISALMQGRWPVDASAALEDGTVSQIASILTMRAQRYLESFQARGSLTKAMPIHWTRRDAAPPDWAYEGEIVVRRMIELWTYVAYTRPEELSKLAHVIVLRALVNVFPSVFAADEEVAATALTIERPILVMYPEGSLLQVYITSERDALTAAAIGLPSPARDNLSLRQARVEHYGVVMGGLGRHAPASPTPEYCTALVRAVHLGWPVLLLRGNHYKTFAFKKAVDSRFAVQWRPYVMHIAGEPAPHNTTIVPANTAMVLTERAHDRQTAGINRGQLPLTDIHAFTAPPLQPMVPPGGWPQNRLRLAVVLCIVLQRLREVTADPSVVSTDAVAQHWGGHDPHEEPRVTCGVAIGALAAVMLVLCVRRAEYLCRAARDSPYRRWRSLTSSQTKFANDMCDELEDRGVIEPVPPGDQHCANMVIVPKKDPGTGAWTLTRRCVDLRRTARVLTVSCVVLQQLSMVTADPGAAQPDAIARRWGGRDPHEKRGVTLAAAISTLVAVVLVSCVLRCAARWTVVSPPKKDARTPAATAERLRRAVWNSPWQLSRRRRLTIVALLLLAVALPCEAAMPTPTTMTIVGPIATGHLSTAGLNERTWAWFEGTRAHLTWSGRVWARRHPYRLVTRRAARTDHVPVCVAVDDAPSETTYHLAAMPNRARPLAAHGWATVTSSTGWTGELPTTPADASDERLRDDIWRSAGLRVPQRGITIHRRADAITVVGGPDLMASPRSRHVHWVPTAWTDMRNTARPHHVVAHATAAAAPSQTVGADAEDHQAPPAAVNASAADDHAPPAAEGTDSQHDQPSQGTATADTATPVPSGGGGRTVRVPTDEEIQEVVNGNPRVVMGTSTANGPFGPQHADPRDNDQPPLVGDPDTDLASPNIVKLERSKVNVERREELSEEFIQEVDRQLAEELSYCFATTFAELPGYSKLKFDIEFHDEDAVAYQRWRNLTGLQKEFADKICNEMKDNGVIEPAPPGNKHCANVVIAPKKDPDTGAWTLMRFCVDLRNVNKLTKPMRRSFPVVEDLFQEIGHHEFYCALDLKAGFHQIECCERARERLTFWWNGKPWRFARMPFGATNSPAVFQNVVEEELKDHLGYARVYIDDVICWADSKEDMLERLKAILKSFGDAGLRVYPKKTNLFMSGVEYLGFIITKNGMRPQQAKVEAIRRIPEPKTQGDVLSFLGLCTYYRWFVEDYSYLTAPLRELTKKGAIVSEAWGDRHRKALQDIKDVLCNPDVGLKRFRPDLPTYVHTDWSEHGISAVLTQFYEEEQTEYMVLAVSRSCNVHEARYPSFYGEMLAATWGVNKLRPYLYGIPFVLVTDHKPITYLLHKRDGLSDMHQRWQLQLQEYQFNIIHREGKKHAIADVPSRHPIPHIADGSGSCLDPLNAAELEEARDQCVNRKPVNPTNRSHEEMYACAVTAQYSRSQAAGTARAASNRKDTWTRGAGVYERHEDVVGDACYSAVPTEEEIHAVVTAHSREKLADREAWVCHSSQTQLSADLSHTVGGGMKSLVAQPRQEVETEEEQQCAAAAVETNPEIPIPKHQQFKEGMRRCAKLMQHNPVNYKTVGPTWWRRARDDGVCILDLCAGIGTALEAALKEGWKIRRYIHVDTDRRTKPVVWTQIDRLRVQYPELMKDCTVEVFRDEAKGDANLPDDVTEWDAETVGRLLDEDAKGAWLVTCGWPCQDFSPAGSGKGPNGSRSTLIVAVTAIIHHMQQRAETAYLLENAAMQYNWKDKELWESILEWLNQHLGKNIWLDAARFGSGAHRLRNFWTNLRDPIALQQAINRTHREPMDIKEALEDATPNEVYAPDRYPWYPRNIAGQARIAMPTFVSYPGSRAFRWQDDPSDQNKGQRPGPGMVLTNKGVWREPLAREKLRMMGHHEHLFRGQHLKEAEQLDLIGRAWDMGAITELLGLAAAGNEPLSAHSAQDHGKSKEEVTPYYQKLSDFRDTTQFREKLQPSAPIDPLTSTPIEGESPRPKGWAVKLADQLRDQAGSQIVCPTIPKQGVLAPPEDVNRQDQQYREYIQARRRARADGTPAPPRPPERTKLRKWGLGYNTRGVASTPTAVSRGADHRLPLAANFRSAGIQGQLPTPTEEAISTGSAMAVLTSTPLDDKQPEISLARGPMWDPWEQDGVWVLAALHDSDEASLRLMEAQPRKWHQFKQWYRVTDNQQKIQLWRRAGGHSEQWLIVPPPGQRVKIAQEAHERTGHWGVRRSACLLATTHWFPKLADQVKQTVDQCEACQRTKASFDGHHPELRPLPIMGMFYRWSVDLATMPETSRSKNKYVMVMIEHYSKYIVLAALPDRGARHTATAFRNHVLAMFGGCAEVLSDNGGEFEGEFEQLLRDNYIDPRRIAPGHSQSNGLAERCVQSVKRALQRMATEDPDVRTQWDERLHLIQLGYNCSRQQATRLIPYEVLFARTPQLPSSATRDFLEAWAATDDQEALIDGGKAEIELVRRIQVVARLHIMAGDNLAIAQQRDTLRYATVRGGGYLPRLRKFEKGDYVRLKHHGANAMQPKAREGVYKFHSYRPGGVVVITGQEETLQYTTQLENLAPSHQQVKQPTDEITVTKNPPKQLACEVCRFVDSESTMLLCDYCDTGWHLHCLNPPLAQVPEGAWFCPPCTAAGRVHVRIKPSDQNRAQSDRGDAELRVAPDELTDPKTGHQYDGWKILKPFEGYSQLFPGYLVYGDGSKAKGGKKKKGLFVVYYEDGDRETNTLAALKPFLVSEQADGSHRRTSRARRPKERTTNGETVAATAELTTALTDVPLETVRGKDVTLPTHFDLGSTDAWLDMLHHLIPGSTWDRGSITRKARQIARGMETALGDNPTRHVTTEGEILPLIRFVNWQRLAVVFDPWAGEATIERVLQARLPHLQVVGNEIDPRCKAHTSLDALQPGNWERWRHGVGPQRRRYDAIVCSPYFPALDLAIPLMLQFADVLFVHVQCTYVLSAPDYRNAWLREHSAAGTMRIIPNLPRGNSGAWKCCWLCIFRTRQLAQDIMKGRSGDMIW